jgi:hypothetical protein
MVGVAFTPDFPLEHIDVVEKARERGGREGGREGESEGGAENRFLNVYSSILL